MKLYQIAHGRAGDKGNISTLSLIPFDEKNYQILCENITVERLTKHFEGVVLGEIVRYEMSNVSSLLFVCHAALDGGVTTSLRLDTHGKALIYRLLEIEVFAE